MRTSQSNCSGQSASFISKPLEKDREVKPLRMIRSKIKIFASFWNQQFCDKRQSIAKENDGIQNIVVSSVLETISQTLECSSSTNVSSTKVISKPIIDKLNSLYSRSQHTLLSKEKGKRRSIFLNAVYNINSKKGKSLNEQIRNVHSNIKLCAFSKHTSKPQSTEKGFSWTTIQSKRRHNAKCDNDSKFGYNHKKSNKLKSKTINTISSISTVGVQQEHIKLRQYPYLSKKSQFSKRSFYAMNFQVDYNTKRRRKLEPYECEPNVCIPGECDPYECKKRMMRRIMRTYSTMTSIGHKTHSISSGTDSTYPHFRSQKNQYRRYEPKLKAAYERRRLQHQTLPAKEDERQAVRIGSSFDFNIEFYKNKSDGGGGAGYGGSYGRGVGSDSTFRSSPSAIYKRKKPCFTCRGTSCGERPCSSKCTAVCSIGTHERGSQSGILMHHRGSGMSPRHKKCFCTLKLMKEGYQNTRQGGIKLNTKNYPRDIMILKTTGQNTRRKGLGNVIALDENECTPGTCIPGECDPYKCLERIKAKNKRHKYVGTEMRSGNASTSSITTYKRYNSKDARHVPKYNQTHSEKTHTERHEQELVSSVSHRSRQVVRVGSSFSFNVEFYKDKGNGYNAPQEESNFTRVNSNLPCITCKPRSKSRRTLGSIKSFATSARSAQSRSLYRDRSDQNSTAIKHRGTAAGKFLERCFCTAKLHSRKLHDDSKSSRFRSYNINGIKRRHKKRKKQDERSTTGKEITVVKISGDCLTQSTSVVYNEQKKQDTEVVMIGGSNMECAQVSRGSEAEEVLKKYPVKEKERLPKYKCAKTCTHCKLFDNKRKFLAARNAIKYAETVTQTDRKREQQDRHLLPYECEPGVCVPGQCDPYVCLKRINKRSARAGTMSYTAKQHSKSIWTESGSRSSNVQSPRYKTTRYKAPRYEMASYDMPHASSSKNAVKIGSNFSFSVEFYKNRNFESGGEHISSRKRQKSPKTLSTGSGDTQIRTKGRNFNTSVSSQDRLSQVDPIKTHHRGIGPMLKRCFCTLALQKCAYNKKCINTTSHGTDTPTCKAVPIVSDTHNQTISYKERSYKLKPHECEPGVCVPGQCDPNECIKLIRRRQHKDAITGMKSKRYKDRDVQIMQMQHQNNHVRNRDVPSSPSHFLSELGGRQSVRIGSSFTFSVEFYRDKNQKAARKRRQRRMKVGTKHGKLSKGVSGSKCNPVDCKSQYNRHIKSKRSGVGILMKRCFCTLKLQNDQRYHGERKPRDSLQDSSVGTKRRYNNGSSLYKQTGTRTRKIYPTVYPLLLPNECEPGICVPGRCNPVQCLKRIKDRTRRQTEAHVEEFDMSMYECEPGVCIPGQCNPYECLERMRKRGKQIKSVLADSKDGYSQYHRNKHHKSQCSPTCKTKDTCLQTCGQKTETRGLEAKPLRLKRCFCTAKLFQQQAIKRKRYPAYTIGRVAMIHTKSPFMPFYKHRRLSEYKKHVFKARIKETSSMLNSDVSKHKQVNLHASLSENAMLIDKNKTVLSKFKEMKTIMPYIPQKFKRHESKLLFSTVRQDYPNTMQYAKTHNSICVAQNKIESIKNYLNFSVTRDPPEILSRRTDKAKHGSANVPDNLAKEILHKDKLKKSESERKPQKQSFDPRETKSAKISKTRVNTLSAVFKKTTKFKYSALQSGDAKCKKKSLDQHGAMQTNKRDTRNITKLNKTQDSNKHSVENLLARINKSEFFRILKKVHSRFYKLVSKIFRNGHSADYADIMIQGKGLKLKSSQENLKTNSAKCINKEDRMISKRDAGDTPNQIDTAVEGNRLKASDHKKNISGIKFTLKGKGAKAQGPVASFCLKARN